MAASPSPADPRLTATLAALMFLAGIDGFLLLETLRELGARPVYLLGLIPLAWCASAGRLRISLLWAAALTGMMALSTIGFLIYGSTLSPFGDKAPGAQFLAHAVLFIIGFSPLALRVNWKIDDAIISRAALYALTSHLVLTAIDSAAILLNWQRPFEGSFLGSVGRDFPTGLFSEPSYLSAYVGMMLPVCLVRARTLTIVLCSVAAGWFFYSGGVRTFFLVNAFSLGVLAWARWGLRLGTVAALVGGSVLVWFVATSLNLLSVEVSLSSAYRLGNTISYFDHAIEHDLLVGKGFGSSHFIYLKLDHPAFMNLSQEYAAMLDGTGQRVPVFNLWVRMAVEVGGLAALALLAVLVRRMFDSKLPHGTRALLAGSLALSMSTDSYIYGMFSLALLLAFTRTERRPAAASIRTTSARPEGTAGSVGA